MTENSSAIASSHSVTLEDRNRLTVEGVEDIIGYDEQSITAKTPLGEMTVHGSDLKIIRMSTDMGELVAEGNIVSVTYSDIRQESGGFWNRVFR